VFRLALRQSGLIGSIVRMLEIDLLSLIIRR
jgi:hypothetical protein